MSGYTCVASASVSQTERSASAPCCRRRSIVATLKNKNIGVIITDHNVDETLAITDRAYLLYEGKVLKTGSPEELAADPEVRKRYLGKHFELRRSPTIDRLRQQGAEAQRSVSETDAEATHE